MGVRRPALVAADFRGWEMTTKSEQLEFFPLWECPECSRLEFSRGLSLTCCDCNARMESIARRDSLSIFEAIGQHFYRDTHYLRPGKDASPLDHRNCDRDAREKAWREWNDQPLDLSQRKSVKPPRGVVR